MGNFIFLSGPSCVGKGPLLRSVNRLCPELSARLNKVVLYTSRLPRPGEVEGQDYRFRSSEQIQSLPDNNHIIFPVHNDLQALPLDDVRRVAEQDGAIGYLEIFHTLALSLRTHPALSQINAKTVFLSPLTQLEVGQLLGRGGKAEVESALGALMTEKLTRRVLLQKGALTDLDRADIAKRAGRAFQELLSAHSYDYIIPNHDGEESPHWALPMLFGDAARTFRSFLDILKGNRPNYFEKWREDFLTDRLAEYSFSSLMDQQQASFLMAQIGQTLMLNREAYFGPLRFMVETGTKINNESILSPGARVINVIGFDLEGRPVGFSSAEEYSDGNWISPEGISACYVREPKLAYELRVLREESNQRLIKMVSLSHASLYVEHEWRGKGVGRLLQWVMLYMLKNELSAQKFYLAPSADAERFHRHFSVMEFGISGSEDGWRQPNIVKYLRQRVWGHLDDWGDFRNKQLIFEIDLADKF